MPTLARSLALVLAASGLAACTIVASLDDHVANDGVDASGDAPASAEAGDAGSGAGDGSTADAPKTCLPCECEIAALRLHDDFGSADASVVRPDLTTPDGSRVERVPLDASSHPGTLHVVGAPGAQTTTARTVVSTAVPEAAGCVQIGFDIEIANAPQGQPVTWFTMSYNTSLKVTLRSIQPKSELTYLFGQRPGTVDVSLGTSARLRIELSRAPDKTTRVRYALGSAALVSLQPPDGGVAPAFGEGAITIQLGVVVGNFLPSSAEAYFDNVEVRYFE